MMGSMVGVVSVEDEGRWSEMGSACEQTYQEAPWTIRPLHLPLWPACEWLWNDDMTSVVKACMRAQPPATSGCPKTAYCKPQHTYIDEEAPRNCTAAHFGFPSSAAECHSPRQAPLT